MRRSTTHAELETRTVSSLSTASLSGLETRCDLQALRHQHGPVRQEQFGLDFTPAAHDCHCQEQLDLRTPTSSQPADLDADGNLQSGTIRQRILNHVRLSFGERRSGQWRCLPTIGRSPLNVLGNLNRDVRVDTASLRQALPHRPPGAIL